METKRKSEKIIFWGFIFIAISFISMIIYFQIQTNALEEKEEQIKKDRLSLEVQQVKLEAERKANQKLNKLVDSSQALVINNSTQTQILSELNLIKNNSKLDNLIYVQVGSDNTKSILSNKNFINTLNSKGYFVVDTYDVVKNGVDNSIRYFNNEDKELANQLKLEIRKEFSIDLKLKFVKGFKVNKGQIEIWIK